jgi:hypothetical protein
VKLRAQHDRPCRRQLVASLVEKERGCVQRLGPGEREFGASERPFEVGVTRFDVVMRGQRAAMPFEIQFVAHDR